MALIKRNLRWFLKILTGMKFGILKIEILIVLFSILLIFLQTFNNTVDKHAHLEELNSINNKKIIYRKYIHVKDLLDKILKPSKARALLTVFETSKVNMKKLLKRY